MKNQKGITLLLLITTLAVMALIIGSVTYNSMYSLTMKNYYNMCADIELLDEKIALYYLEKGELPVDKNNIKNVRDLVQEYSESNVNYNPNNGELLYKIDLSKLDNLSLNYSDYYIDSQSHTIYFNQDIIVDGTKYYTVPSTYEKIDVNKYQ